ncbi:dienelactone hydrolase [Jiulongibacter sediminis]|jgi:predicted dienelactone hydrolase|uniref:alpha/beta hydrolase family protein n=1 Tax=Jiulongibacter sediminis TaxID=1605367 RepID=UPI0026F058DA|nr:dienelactone hydrolase [Jiulongibacter sediminis]
MKTLNKLFTFLIMLLVGMANAQEFVYGDALPDAPELAARGQHKVGVRTLQFIHKNQPDILNAKDGKAPLYDRDLTVEVWYPAEIDPNDTDLITYNEVMGTAGDTTRPLIPFTFKGRATRNARIKSSNESYPLVVVSHGYVGSRYLMTYLTENLASKGYIVAAIDHKESTFRDAANFTSTLINRSPDIRFVLESMRSTEGDAAFFKGSLDADNMAIVGYSMGGYGVLNVAGGAYSKAFNQGFKQFSGGSDLLSPLVEDNPEFKPVPEGLKAVVAMAPWGKERMVWSAESLRGLKVPTFFLAGDQDDISGYEKGIKAIYEEAVFTERFLLTYANARHNIAPNPPPAEAMQPGLHFDEYYRYAEPNWDQRRINNINQHFITAFLDWKLKGVDTQSYFAEPDEKGLMKGFKPRTFLGLTLRQNHASK